MRDFYQRRSRAVATKLPTVVVLQVSAVAVFSRLIVFSIFSVRMIGESFKNAFGDGTAYLTVVNETDSDIVVRVDYAVGDPLTVGEPAPDRRRIPDDVIYWNGTATVDVPFSGGKPQGIDRWIYAFDAESAIVVYFKETTFGELADSGWALRIAID